MHRFLLTLTLLTYSAASFSADSAIKVLALFSNKALMQIDGEQKFMKKGENFNGVTLVSSSGRGAVVRLADGEELTLGINQSIQHGFKKTQNSRMTIYADRAGMFSLDGKINDQSTRFLLDTGATYIAMSEVEADRLGINYESAKKTLIQTASEVVPVWNIKLDRVKVGDISVPQVEAVVLQGDSPRVVLLGMSFLRHLKLQRNGSALVLEQKY
jgi:aspartyl protease family protein